MRKPYRCNLSRDELVDALTGAVGDAMIDGKVDTTHELAELIASVLIAKEAP